MIRKIGISTFLNINTINDESKRNINTVNKSEKLSRVEEIKRAIENGTYKIDIEITARAMAKALL
jgi:anti-sigma28 factor (negative regulator of flagellin synthesis)